MKTTYISLIVTMASLFAASAFAEGKQLSLNGGPNSPAEEVVSILSRAGVQRVQEVEGAVYNEKNIEGGSTFLGTPRYSVTFTIEAGSSGEESQKNLTLQGEIAAELFDNMAKAGLPLRHVQLGQAYAGENVLCTVMANAAGGEHHICSISLK